MAPCGSPYAAPGDTDLNGVADVFDLVGVNGSGTYGSGLAADWSQGDFNYDGTTSVFDLVAVTGAGVLRHRQLPPGVCDRERDCGARANGVVAGCSRAGDLLPQTASLAGGLESVLGPGQDGIERIAQRGAVRRPIRATRSPARSAMAASDWGVK